MSNDKTKPAALTATEAAALKDRSGLKDVQRGVDHGVRPRELTSKELRQMEESELAQRFAAAMLSNPRGEQVFGFDPFAPSQRLLDGGTSRSGGENLAMVSHRLARDYLAALKKLTAGD